MAKEKADVKTRFVRENADKRERYYKLSERQLRFLDVVSKAQVSYKSAANDFVKGGIRRKRMKAMCKVLKSSAIKNWSGKLSQLTSNGDGNGVVTIDLGRGISVKTSNNSFSDIGSNTLIDPDSPVFGKFARMAIGEKLRFSGRLFRTKEGPDCFQELSLTMDGAMEEPEFLIRFTDATNFANKN